MMIPVRCFTCGKLVGDKWEEWVKRLQDGEDPDKILDDLGLTRVCCRRMMVSHIDLIDDIIQFSI